MKIVLAGLVLAFGVTPAIAATAPQPQLVIVTLKDHRFVPDTITVPAGVRVRIDVTNRDATADDFDSDDLHVDKDLAPHGRASFIIGPLKPGSYAFKGELHAATAQGVVVAVDAGK
jgi:plastocyanin domain-containing protein